MTIFGTPRAGQFAGPRGNVHDLRSAIQAATDKAQAILDTAQLEAREFTARESEEFEAALAEANAIKPQLRQAEAERDRKLALAEAQASVNNSNHFFADRSALGYQTPMSTSQITHKMPHLKAFQNTPQGRRDAFLAGNWWKAIVNRHRGAVDEQAEGILANAGVDIRASLIGGDPTSGGYLVPTPMSNTIIDVRALAGVARRVCRILPMSSETHSEPKLLAGPSVVYAGEGGTINDSDESWGQVSLTCKKRAILTKVSRELRDDAIIGVIDHLASRMAHEFALKEDSEFISGDGSSSFGGEVGLLSALGAGGIATAASGHDTWGELDMTDFTACMAKLPSKFSQNAVWICSMNFYASAMLRALAAAGGNSMISLSQGVDEGLFLGKKVYFSDFMPTSTAASTICALYGSFSDAAILGDRQGVEIMISDQRYFEQDLIGVRATTRYDFNVHEGGDANAPGAYVALKTNS